MKSGDFRTALNLEVVRGGKRTTMAFQLNEYGGESYGLIQTGAEPSTPRREPAPSQVEFS
ncbi:MAG: hypothetical protein ACFCBW_11210 [Candidatus Competibacterales bacterium]